MDETPKAKAVFVADAQTGDTHLKSIAASAASAGIAERVSKQKLTTMIYATSASKRLLKTAGNASWKPNSFCIVLRFGVVVFAGGLCV